MLKQVQVSYKQTSKPSRVVGVESRLDQIVRRQRLIHPNLRVSKQEWLFKPGDHVAVVRGELKVNVILYENNSGRQCVIDRKLSTRPSYFCECLGLKSAFLVLLVLVFIPTKDCTKKKKQFFLREIRGSDIFVSLGLTSIFGLDRTRDGNVSFGLEKHDVPQNHVDFTLIRF